MAAAYGLARIVSTARVFAASQPRLRNTAPGPRSQPSFVRAIASVPVGTSPAAGPVTSMRTERTREASPGTTLSVTSIGSAERSTVTLASAEKKPSASAAARACAGASRTRRSSSSSVMSAKSCQRTRSTLPRIAGASAEGASIVAR